jgi:hypothetical protein
MHSRSYTLISGLLYFALAAPVLASNGVLEINQTCAVQTGCFAGDSVGLPVTISTGGSYRLTSNLIVPDENTDGILLAAADVGIDLNGFSIIRSGCEDEPDDCTPTSGSGSGVYSQSLLTAGHSVKNGGVVGMGSYGIRLGINSEVRNVRARWNRLDGINARAGAVVSGNSSYENGRDGIAASSASISGNTAYNNGDDGIEAGQGSTVTGNAASFNGSDQFAAGIETDEGCVVRDNSVRFNGGYGLRLGTGSAYGANVITDNGIGTVIGGISILLNACDGANAPNCP